MRGAGVPRAQDRCPHTRPGDVSDGSGCSEQQRVEAAQRAEQAGRPPSPTGRAALGPAHRQTLCQYQGSLQSQATLRAPAIKGTGPSRLKEYAAIRESEDVRSMAYSRALSAAASHMLPESMKSHPKPQLVPLCPLLDWCVEPRMRCESLSRRAALGVQLCRDGGPSCRADRSNAHAVSMSWDGSVEVCLVKWCAIGVTDTGQPL